MAVGGLKLPYIISLQVLKHEQLGYCQFIIYKKEIGFLVKNEFLKCTVILTCLVCHKEIGRHASVAKAFQFGRKINLWYRTWRGTTN